MENQPFGMSGAVAPDLFCAEEVKHAAMTRTAVVKLTRLASFMATPSHSRALATPSEFTVMFPMAIWQTSLLARRGIYPHSVYQFSIRPHIAPESTTYPDRIPMKRTSAAPDGSQEY
jgi:hypothetical protein